MHTHTHAHAYKFMVRKMRWSRIAQVFTIVCKGKTHFVFQNQKFVACLSPSVLFIHFIHLLSHLCEFPTFRVWFRSLPCSLSHTVFIRNFPPLHLAEMLSPLDIYLIPVPSARFRLLSPLSWEQLVWTRKRTHTAVGRREIASRAYISSGNATSLPDPPSSQPNLYRSHKVSTGNDSRKLSKHMWFTTPFSPCPFFL